MSERPQGDPGVVAEALDRGRRAVAGVAEGFRRTGRWKRMRLGFVGGWLVASLVALFIACPRTGPANSLGADVQLLRDSLLGQQILVRNESDEVWTDVVLLLDGGWRHTVRTLRPREQVVVSPSQFDRAGEPAPRDLRLRRLSIECGQGSATVELR